MELTDKEKQALRIIASQETGQIFLKGLMRECHYQKPTITMDGFRDLSLGLTAYYEALRGVWLDLRVNIDIDKLSIIELDERKSLPAEIIKDIDHERSNDSNTEHSEPNDADDKSVGGTVRKRRDKFERDSKDFARQYIANIYPEPRDATESTDSGSS